MASSRLTSALRLLRVHPRRLLVAPRVALPSLEGADGELRVEGMLCTVCAARTGDALRSVPGVEGVTVDLDAQRAVVRLAPGARADLPAMQTALDGVVLGVGLRRWVERAARRVRSRAA